MIIRFILLSLILCLSSGCGFKTWIAREFMQGTLADGVARLSVQHVSMMTGELNEQFESDAAKIEIIPSEKADEHGRGTVIIRLENYVVDFPQVKEAYRDCNHDIALWQGKIIVNATKTMYGRLTNHPKKPIIPDPLSVRIDVEARADNLSIYFPSRDERLKIMSGTFRFTAFPRLARNSDGMRLAVTPNTRFENVRLINMRALLSTKDIEMEIPIKDSSLTMQVGKGEEGDENLLSGTIDIFDNHHTVPRDGLGLDPEYHTDKFLKTYTCLNDFKEGVIYDEHISIEQKLAPGVGSLTGRVMGILASHLERNSTCGFLSGPAVETMTLQGKPGELGAYEESLPSECVLDFQNYQTQPDCFGVAYRLNGKVSVATARKILSGFVTMDGEQLKNVTPNYSKKYAQGASLEELLNAFPKAVIPQSRQPISFNIDAAFENFSMTDVCINQGLTDHAGHCLNKKAPDSVYRIFSGSVKAQVKPVLAKDMKEGETKNYCVIPTSAGNAEINFSDLTTSISRDGNELHVLASANYRLVNGQVGDKENELEGEMCIGNDCIALDKAKVDSKYERQSFLDGMFLCNDSMKWTVSDDECRIEDGAHENVARLLVVNAGALMKIASSPQIPGSFASLSAIRTRTLSNNGTTLVLKASQKNQIDISKKISSHVDGTGVTEKIEGMVSMLEGTMTRNGVSLQEKGFLNNLNPLNNRFMEGLKARMNGSQEIFVRPSSPGSTKITLKAHLDEFVVLSQLPKAAEHTTRLVIDSADYTIDATPIMGIDKRTQHDVQPSFSIPTPIVKLNGIQVTNLKGRIMGPNFELPIHVSHARLRAFNGKYQGQGNYLEGDIALRVGNHASLKSYQITRTKLNPSYVQDEFDHSYENTPHLSAVLSPH